MPYAWGEIQNPRLVGIREEIDGPSFHTIEGTVPWPEHERQVARNSIPVNDPNREAKLVSLDRAHIQVRLWVNQQNYRVHRQEEETYMEGWSSTSDTDGGTTSGPAPVSIRSDTRYYDFNAPMTIEAPPID